MSTNEGGTIGLECNGYGKRTKLIRVEFEKFTTHIKLKPVSGHNLRKAGASVSITHTQWEERPQDPYNSVALAIWALKLCGWTPSALDNAE